jgi:hypothetical protein
MTKHLGKTVMAITFAVVASTGCASHAQRAPRAGVTYVVVDPPPPRRDVIVVRPSSSHVWVDGYWAWRGREYVWTPGRWDLPPRGYRSWVPGRWQRERHGWFWIGGRWR